MEKRDGTCWSEPYSGLTAHPNPFLVREELPRGVNFGKDAPVVVFPSLLGELHQDRALGRFPDHPASPAGDRSDNCGPPCEQPQGTASRGAWRPGSLVFKIVGQMQLYRKTSLNPCLLMGKSPTYRGYTPQNVCLLLVSSLGFHCILIAV